MKGRQNSAKYTEVLEENLISFLGEFHQNEAVFQQDNAAIYTSKHTREWLTAKNINTLSWPAKSPNLNPIENLWGIQARQVYAGGRHYSSKEELQDAVQECWSKIPQNLLII